jgi:phenylalanyl-tRNA synthetase beta chain
MYISINWLKKVIPIKNLKINKKKLLLKYAGFSLNKLTFGGFEVEKVSLKNVILEKDTIIEISATPNRSDISNLVSLSKETKILLNRPLQKSIIYKTQIPDFIKNSKEIKKQNEKIGETIYLYQINNFEIKESPQWLKKRLISANVQPQNNIKDLLNYSILEWGYPVNAYDLKKILKKLNKNEILNFQLTTAKQNQIFVNRNIEYRLNNKIMLVKANEIVLSIAGLINNEEYEIDENTTHILVESLALDKKNIKATSKCLGVRTPGSIAYEKGISKGIGNIAFQHFVRLIGLTNRFEKINTKLNITDKEQETKKITQLNLKDVKNILGEPKKRITQLSRTITNLEILSCIKKLDYKIIRIENEVCHLLIPNNRVNQIQNANDVAEEIGRIYSYNKIQSILPIIKKQGKITQEQKLIALTKKKFINKGFSEVVTYSLVNKSDENSIKLINPLSNEYIYLRKSLLINLIEIIKTNKNQQNNFSSCFEIGRTYNKSLKEENNMISGIFGGEDYKLNWNNKNQNLNWYEAKEIVTNFLELNNIKSNWIQIKNNIGIEYHPGRSALIMNDNIIIGIFTQIHPLYAKQNNLVEYIYLFELNLTKISQIQVNKKEKYKNYSIYPKIIKDISFEVSKFITADQFLISIKTIIEKLNEDEIEILVKIFDSYENLKKPNVHVLGIKVTYQSIKKTLSTTEIEKLNEKIITETNRYLGGT